jgi:SAM-dependent methyltransferase
MFSWFNKEQRIVRLIQSEPKSIKAWLTLIDHLNSSGELDSHYQKLVLAHELSRSGHAVNAFSDTIAQRGGVKLEEYAQSPVSFIDLVIDELVKWKTIAQCAHSHDVSKGYFIDAEAVINFQWTNLIYPLIKDMDFTTVLDLACGHGRNSEYLRTLTNELHLLDINQSCIDVCKERFGTEKNGTQFFYHLTNGNDLSAIGDAQLTFVYSWDSMVHFDKLVVRDYVVEIKRILKPGGTAFLHHSNYGAVAPDSDWAHNSGTRSDMSAELMRQFAAEAGLEVVTQHLQGRKEGWGLDDLDCVSLLRRPVAQIRLDPEELSE